MAMQLKIEEQRGFGWLVRVSGAITEQADFRALTGLAETAPLRLDLAGVEQINSCGVREWIHFVRRLSSLPHPFELVGCSPAIVRQINMISNFCGSGTVRSVLLPYYCEPCGHEEMRMLDLPARGTKPDIEQIIACGKCGASAEFDDLPDAYLTFQA